MTPSLRLLRPLGRGGMGVLWIAQHRALDSEVVVKFLTDELADDASAATRFAQEAAAAARVKSPHVVQILDYGVTAQGAPFIVMELLEGQDLGAHLAAHGALPPEETIAIVRQLSKALGKAHAAGIVHRDVKPSNVFLCDGDGEPFVKLLDFGIAKRTVGDLARSGSDKCIGTPRYMSPEQMVGGAVDARSDLWSLGVLAFECLTGKRPFDGETLGALALAIHTLPAPRPSELAPALPHAFDAWFLRACARDPDARFPSAIEAADALARAFQIDLRTTKARPQAIEALPPVERTGTLVFGAEAGGAAPPIAVHGPRMRALAIAVAAMVIGIVAFGAQSERTGLSFRTGPRPERALASPRKQLVEDDTRLVEEHAALPAPPARSPAFTQRMGDVPRVALTIADPATAASERGDSGAAPDARARLYEMPDERH